MLVTTVSPTGLKVDFERVGPWFKQRVQTILGFNVMRFRDEFEDSMNDDAGCEVAVFTEAIKVPFQERAAFLDNACRGDENLRRKVEALLRAHDRMGNFLEEPPTGASTE
jgi:hypothetical protein